MADIHKDYEAIKSVAQYVAKEHNCNYHLIIFNPTEEGEFGDGSTYEFVTDSYFEKERPNVKLLETIHPTYTIDEIVEMGSETSRLLSMFDDPYKNQFLTLEPLLNDGLYSLGPRVDQYRRERPKVHRNEPCKCGSGKKFKKCCINS